MAYDNITEATTDRMENWVHTNWVTNQDAGIFKKKCLSRVAYLVLAPASAIPRAIDAILCIGATLGLLVNLPTGSFARKRGTAAQEFLVQPYLNLLKVFQPSRKLSDQAWVSHEGMGLITDVAYSRIRAFANYMKDPATNNRAVEFTPPRTEIALSLLITPITRIADAILSVPATALSLLMLGKCETLNNIAYRALQAPDVLTDIVASFVYLCRPGVFSFGEES